MCIRDRFWEVGGALGYSPIEIGQTSLWEFQCAYAGWLRSIGADTKDEAPSDEDHEALIAAFKAAEAKEANNG